MSYILTNDENEIIAYPYSIYQLKIDNPNTSFPQLMTEAMLNECNVYTVKYTDAPQYNWLEQNLINGTPEYIDGEWFQTWVVEELSDEDKAERLSSTWDQIRNERNERLKQSDWTQVQDSPVDRNAWAEYRNALRNIPQDNDNPLNIVWPVEP